MTFYNHIESVRGIAIDLTNGRKWRGASDKAAVFDALDAARREYMSLSDENAKLRELVRDMWEGYNDPRCEECHLKDTPKCADCPICAREASVIDRMRELEVEP